MGRLRPLSFCHPHDFAAIVSAVFPLELRARIRPRDFGVQYVDMLWYFWLWELDTTESHVRPLEWYRQQSDLLCTGKFRET